MSYRFSIVALFAMIALPAGATAVAGINCPEFSFSGYRGKPTLDCSVNAALFKAA